MVVRWATVVLCTAAGLFIGIGAVARTWPFERSTASVAGRVLLVAAILAALVAVAAPWMIILVRRRRAVAEPPVPTTPAASSPAPPYALLNTAVAVVSAVTTLIATVITILAWRLPVSTASEDEPRTAPTAAATPSPASSATPSAPEPTPSLPTPAPTGSGGTTNTRGRDEQRPAPTPSRSTGAGSGTPSEDPGLSEVATVECPASDPTVYSCNGGIFLAAVDDGFYASGLYMEEWRVRDSRTDLRRDASSLYTDNGGTLAVVDAGSGLSYQKCASASGWRDRISFDDLARGSQLCVRTGNARYAGVLVRSVPNPESPYAVVAGYTWR